MSRNQQLPQSRYLYPQLRDGCVLRICPSITGPTGTRVRNLVGARADAEMQAGLSPASFYELSEGRYAGKFSGAGSDSNLTVQSTFLARYFSGTRKPMSISMWFRHPGDWASFKRRMIDSDGAGTTRNTTVWVESATSIHVAMRRQTGAVITTPFTMVADTWYHLALTLPPELGAAAPIQLYLNGIPATGTVNAGNAAWETKLVVFGTNPSSGGANFTGSLDDMAIYDRVLSADEVRLLARHRGISETLERRTWASVPSSIFDRIESDILLVTDEHTRVVHALRSHEDDVNLNDTATRSISRDRSASDTLALTDEVLNASFIVRDASDTLGITDGVTKEGIYNRSRTDTLGITDSATRDISTSSTTYNASSTLAFTDSVVELLFGASRIPVIDVLTFTQSVTVQNREDGTSPLPFLSVANFRVGIPPGGYFLTDTLNLDQSLKKVNEIIIGNIIGFTDTTYRLFTGVDTLVFTQATIKGRAKSASSEMLLTQTNLLNSRLNRLITQAANLLQAAAYYSTGKCVKSRYSRFEGAGQAQPLPTKVYSQRTDVSFETLSGPKQIIPITTPEMDNKHRLAFDRVNRETVGGELEVYRDPTWTPTQTLLFTITGLKEASFTTLKAFMYSTLGQEILFNDWLGATWKGVITNPDEPATEDQDGYWTLAFELVGAPYGGPPAFAPLAFTQTASFTVE